MSMGFTKLFTSITESTVWMTPQHTRIVWITMLSMADRSGNVYASVPGLAHRARVTVDECRDALATLAAPDEDSRTKLFEGRRILPFEGGWTLLNHAKYRKIQDEEAIRESKKEYMRRLRCAEESGIVTSTLATVEKTALDLNSESRSDLVTTPDPKSRRRAKTELPEDFAPNAQHQTIAAEQGVDLTEQFALFVDHWRSKGDRRANWDATLRNWLRRAKRFGGASVPQQTLLFQFPENWRPTKEHRAKGLDLGLTVDEILARADDCRLKPIKQGFTDPDQHFYRELAWAKRDKDADRARRESYANRKDFETPGHSRN